MMRSLNSFSAGATLTLEASARPWRIDPDRCNSNSAATIAHMPDNAIQYICLLIARFGLEVWRPDFREDAYSTWNNAHRFLALETFKQAIALLAFRHTGIVAPPEHIRDLGLLARMYDHVVHHYFYKLYRRELRNPGALARATQMSSDSKHILVVSKHASCHREIDLTLSRLPKHATIGPSALVILRVSAVQLLPSDTVSDVEKKVVERSGGGVETVWERKVKTGRHPVATRFAHHVDDSIWMERQGNKRGNKGFQRVTPAASLTEGRLTLPTDVPVDYYEPSFFNSRPITWRGQFNKGVNFTPVFPANADDLFQERPIPDFRKLNNNAWERQYGDDLRKPFQIPTAAQMSNEDTDDDEDQEMEDEQSQRTQYDPRNSASQQTFVNSTAAAGSMPVSISSLPRSKV